MGRSKKPSVTPKLNQAPILKNQAPILKETSRSHRRREKRKARAKAASTNMDTISTALDDVVSDDEDLHDEKPSGPKTTPGKRAHLRNNKRSEIFKTEAQRMQSVINNEEFNKNPFELIQRQAEFMSQQ